jgi:SAM-dependent methyltransferase
MRSEPDRDLALAKYRRRARSYDRFTRGSNGLRWIAVSRLLLRAGDVVLDVGCGTGINFSFIEKRIGPEGRVIGIELSPEMLAEAEKKIAAHGWTNVTLIQAAAEEAKIPAQADAALFALTHDILQSSQAVANVMANTRKGGRVSSFGAKWAPRWAVPVNVAVWLIARRYVTTFKGFDHPWALLESYVRDLRVESVAFGGAYVAWGTKG